MTVRVFNPISVKKRRPREFAVNPQRQICPNPAGQKVFNRSCLLARLIGVQMTKQSPIADGTARRTPDGKSAEIILSLKPDWQDCVEQSCIEGIVGRTA